MTRTWHHYMTSFLKKRFPLGWTAPSPMRKPLTAASRKRLHRMMSTTLISTSKFKIRIKVDAESLIFSRFTGKFENNCRKQDFFPDRCLKFSRIKIFMENLKLFVNAAQSNARKQYFTFLWFYWRKETQWMWCSNQPAKMSHTLSGYCIE